MNGLYAGLIVLAILLLIGCIRLGVQVEYCEQGLVVRIRIGRIYHGVFPVKKSGKSKPQKSVTVTTPKQKKGGLLHMALDLIPTVLDTVKRFFRKLQVDKLKMNLVICAADPADAAVHYGQANALLGCLWQPITTVFHVKDGHAHVGVDFDGGESTLYILAELSLTIGQILCLALVFGVKALGILIRTRSKQEQPQQGKAV